MKRRHFIEGSTLALLAIPLHAEAQRTTKIPRIAYVSANPKTVNVDAFNQGLQDRGYVIGQDVVIEYRFADGRLDRVRPLVDEVLGLGVAVLLAANPYVIRVAREASRTVPIVGIDLETDPIAAGWVQTLAKPRGNVTGLFLDMPELSGKLVQLLSEAVPRLQRVAVLWDAELAPAQFKATENAAQTARLKVQPLGFRQPSEFASMVAAAQAEKAQALIFLSSPTVFPYLQRLADLARETRLPSISTFLQFAAAGGLIGYGPSLADLYRRASGYVDLILKGEKAADMPIQRPAVFHLVINLRTAKALGLTIPPSLLLRADEVIQE